jgi:hypothetical protein
MAKRNNKEITVSLVHYNETLTALMKRFPEIKTPIEKQVEKLEKTKEYNRIIVGMVYTSRDAFPKSMSIRIECFDGKKPNPYTFAMHFKSQWILE